MSPRLITAARGGIALALVPLVLVAAGAVEPSSATGRVLQAPAGTTRVSYHAETGEVRFLTTKRGRPLERPDGFSSTARPEAVARAFLAEDGRLFGVENQARDLRTERTVTEDGRNRSFVRFQQVHRGVPVMAGELVVQLDKERDPVATTGEILPDVDLDVAPAVDAETARQTAIAAVRKEYGVLPRTLRASEPELWIYDSRLLGGPGADRPTLVWRTTVTTTRVSPIDELVLVDAKLGVVALHFNQVEFARNRSTYTANNTSALPGTLKCGEGSPLPFCAGGDPDVEGAHRGAGDTYDFYASRNGRDSYDDAGAPIVSTVHWRDPDNPTVPFPNAFWYPEGKQMVFGDAETFTQADDVIGHELTHAVNERESKLFYYYQSGAIDESLADVFGEFIDLTNGRGNDTAAVRWLMGEDVLPGGPARSLKDPTAFGDPDRMTSPNYWTSESDEGGVHGNSGINNKAAYLMTDGDTFNGKTVSGIGLDKTEAIYYEAQTNLLTSGSDYQDLYDALQQACANLIGTHEITASNCQEVKDAVDAVEMNLPAPGAAATFGAPVCTTGVPTNLFFDNLENPAGGNWTTGALFGQTRWFYPQNPNPFTGFDATWATSGVTNFWGYDTNIRVDTYIAQTAGVTLPAGTSYMRFNHAYVFEHGSVSLYDGGVVEYSTNGGGSWNDAGPLFTHGGYRGTISSSFGNPLGGRQGFGGTSRGYGSSRLDLTPLAGQNVRFRFRIGTDSSGSDYGWFIDDVRIYTCGLQAPGAPQNVRALPGDGEATVSFLPPASNGGVPVTSYTLTVSPGGQTFTTTGTMIFVTGLENGTSYTFTVTATNGIGTGPPSAASAAVTPLDVGRPSLAPPPDQPRPAVPDPPGGTRPPPP